MTALFPAENLRDWRGRDVVDAAGGSIGSLEAIYVDTLTDEPFFATVQVGRLRNKRLVFVPLDGATVSPDHLRVRPDNKTAKSAPSIELDGELPADGEPAIFAHYGLSYEANGVDRRRLARR